MTHAKDPSKLSSVGFVTKNGFKEKAGHTISQRLSTPGLIAFIMVSHPVTSWSSLTCFILAFGQLLVWTAAGAQDSKTPAQMDAGASKALVDQLVAASQKHAYQRRADTTGLLWSAESAAADMASDASEYNRWMTEIIMRYANGPAAEDAGYLASRLPAGGAAVAWSKIALLDAQKGQSDQARTALQQLGRHLAEVTGQNIQKVSSRRSETLSLINEKAEAEKLRQTLGGVEMLELEIRLRQQGKEDLIDLRQAQGRLDLIEAKGIDRLRARYLLACAEQQLKSGHREAALPFFPEVGRLATSEGLPTAQHVLLDLARVCWSGGESKEAFKAMNIFAKCAGMFPDGADWKCIYLAEAAEILWKWGKKEEARVWLKKSKDLLPKVFVLEAPQTLFSVARVVEQMETPAAADALVSSALTVGRSQNHAVFQGAVRVQAFLHYFDAGRPVPEAVAEILKAGYVGEEK